MSVSERKHLPDVLAPSKPALPGQFPKEEKTTAFG